MVRAFCVWICLISLSVTFWLCGRSVPFFSKRFYPMLQFKK